MSDTITPRLRIKAQPEVSVRAKVVPPTKVRLRVLPSLLPMQIELQNTGTMIQWRYLGQAWQDLIAVDDLDTTVTVGTVTTLPAGSMATVVNVGTAKDMVLNFGIPAGNDGTDGTDGVMASVVPGDGIGVDATDPANPIVSADVESVAGLTGAILAAALKTALAIGVADITDASANGRSLISAANYAAMKSLLGLNNVDNTSDATKNSAAVTLTNKTIADPIITGTVREDTFAITDAAGFAIDPRNGSIQRITLGASRTPVAANFNDGDGVLMKIADGTAYTITWTTVGVVWLGGSAPTLATSGWTWVALWKENGTIYGKHVGDSA